MTPTTSQGQLRRREAGWEGSRRRDRDPRNTWRIGAWTASVGCAYKAGRVRASRPVTAKPVVVKGPLRRRGGCAMKVAGLTRGDLRGCPRCPVLLVRGVVRDDRGREAAVRRGEVSRGHTTGGDHQRRKGPNAKPRRRTLVLAGWTLNAANPQGAWTGRSDGEARRPPLRAESIPGAWRHRSSPRRGEPVGAVLVPRESR